MTDKTTAALKLAEEALYAELESDTCEEFAEAAEKCHKAIAAIREALAGSKPAPDGRIPKTVFTLDDISKAAEMGRQAGMIDALAEPVKQEPVAVISESAIGLVKLHSNGACLPFGTQFYAAPVSAKREWIELTDDEIYDALAEVRFVRDNLLDGCRALIAAFKERNK